MPVMFGNAVAMMVGCKEHAWYQRNDDHKKTERRRIFCFLSRTVWNVDWNLLLLDSLPVFGAWDPKRSHVKGVDLNWKMVVIAFFTKIFFLMYNIALHERAAGKDRWVDDQMT
jgi:hypothetical protein